MAKAILAVAMTRAMVSETMAEMATAMATTAMATTAMARETAGTATTTTGMAVTVTTLHLLLPMRHKHHLIRVPPLQASQTLHHQALRILPTVRHPHLQVKARLTVTRPQHLRPRHPLVAAILRFQPHHP
jgi:hypothetical protein